MDKSNHTPGVIFRKLTVYSPAVAVLVVASAMFILKVGKNKVII